MVLSLNVSYRVKINSRLYDPLTGVYNIKIPADMFCEKNFAFYG